jgi:BirA family biotin operon repressor/biotin-[acetyl-CoA-carboxylase] ligase
VPIPPPATPLDPTVLRRALCPPAGPWASVQVVARTGSTNADLLAAAEDGPAAAPDRSVLVAEHQEAGRGRRDRTWETRPSEGLTLSVLLRPDEVPVERWGWAPLLVGLALADAVAQVGPPGLEVALKWPNDLLLGPDQAKAAGILAEVASPAGEARGLVVGLGLNVSSTRENLPAGATSLAALGVPASRQDVLVAVLAALAGLDDRWRAAGGDVVASGLADAYRARCATLDQPVRVLLPGDRVVQGRATAVDDDGRLHVLGPDGETTVVSAGDVVHVRPDGR